MAPEYGNNIFDSQFYIHRRGLRNPDDRDNSRRETTNGNYLLRLLERAVTLGNSMGERDVHAGAMRNHAKQIDLNGPKAVAGREEAVHPVLLNSTTGKTEPAVLAQMNDRLACMQEITVGLCQREDNELELIALLQSRGLTNEGRYLEDDDDA